MSRALARASARAVALLVAAGLAGACTGTSPTPSAPASSAPETTVATAETAAPTATPVESSAPETRTITDMAGASITIPLEVDTVATVGSVPVINGTIFAVGEGATIANGLPAFASSPKHKYQTVFAPQLAGAPVTQNAEGTPDIEVLLSLDLDVAFTMTESVAVDLNERGVPTIFLAWHDPDDVKQAVRLVGEVFGQQEKAEDYVAFFEETIERVGAVVGDIPDSERVSAIHMIYQSMTRPHTISDWWIATAGGVSSTAETGVDGNYQFSLEELLAWDPDWIIVSDASEPAQVLEDPRLSGISAVVNERVVTNPVGTHLWGNRVIELPVNVLWTAKTFYPDRFAGLDIVAETQQFYQRFFGAELSRVQVEEILAGVPIS